MIGDVSLHQIKQSAGDRVSSIPLESRAGEAGEALLAWASSVLDATDLAAWKDAGGGNCFFASNDAMFKMMPQLVDSEKGLDTTFLTTGRLDHPDTPKPVIHAWIEFRMSIGTLVLNVSNLSPDVPMYAARKGDYRRLNSCKTTIQRISAREIVKKYGDDAKDGEEVRAITKQLLAPTMKRIR